MAKIYIVIKHVKKCGKINGPEKNYGEIKCDKIIVNWGQALALHGGHYSKVLKRQQSDQQKCKNDNYFMTSQALLGTEISPLILLDMCLVPL